VVLAVIALEHKPVLLGSFKIRWRGPRGGSLPERGLVQVELAAGCVSSPPPRNQSHLLGEDQRLADKPCSSWPVYVCSNPLPRELRATIAVMPITDAEDREHARPFCVLIEPALYLNTSKKLHSRMHPLFVLAVAITIGLQGTMGLFGFYSILLRL